MKEFIGLAILAVVVMVGGAWWFGIFGSMDQAYNSTVSEQYKPLYNQTQTEILTTGSLWSNAGMILTLAAVVGAFFLIKG